MAANGKVPGFAFNAMATGLGVHMGIESIKMTLGLASIGAPLSATFIGLSLIPQALLLRTNWRHTKFYLDQMSDPAELPFNAKRHVVFPVLRTLAAPIITTAAVMMAQSAIPQDVLENLKKRAEEQQLQQKAEQAGKPASALVAQP